MTDFVIVLTTFPVDKDPETVAKILVDEKLAACVNILPVMRSIYSWKGATEHADERQLVIKTSRDRVHEIETRLRALHPYDVPEFLVVPILEGSRDYLSWLTENSKP
ncbi:MAG TPA: divalent-cation tolerance protein CutA [Vicinamibacterales bacterium]|nr:divalent-cation tolerance protein CutA [Vicinamibacterales bacterium]